MISEIICTICFSNKPKYLRQCKCFYCEDCRSRASEVCFCGSSGTFIQLNQETLEEEKGVALDSIAIYNKIFESLYQKFSEIIKSYFNYFNKILEIRVHQEKQFQKYLLSKIKNLELENENLKKKNSVSQPVEKILLEKPSFARQGFDNKESQNFFDSMKYTTPRYGKLNGPPSSIIKKPFNHDGFSAFFNRK